MGTYCFDQYQHPILWCDEKKRFVERQNAAESIHMYKRKKAEELAQVERDKKDYREMIVKHCPWGRPGGGAPNLDIRMRNILTEGLQPTPKCSFRSSALPPCRFNCDGGSKIRSAADRLYITLKDHPSMTLRNKGHLDIELRYKTTPKGKKKMKLDKIVVTEQKNSNTNKGRRKAVEEPWGQPGPGGVPWRNPKTVGSSFMRSLGWTNKELLKELDQDNPQTTPSEKSVVKVKEVPKEPIRDEVKKCCPTCTCKCGTAPPVNSGERRKSSIKKSNSKEDSVYNDYPPKTGPKKERRQRCYSPPSRTDAYCRPKPRKDSKKGSTGPNGVELVPLLARRRGMHRPISLSSTDVTKRTADNSRFTSYDSHLLNELKRQISHKRHRERTTRAVEEDQCKQHFDTFDTYWSRPGHGAPRDTIKKMNLDDLLYGVPVD